MTEQDSSPRQTLSYLRTLLEERGIKPKNKLGQNFLIDLNLLDLIVKVSSLGKEDLVLEIGSGTGSLTAKLAAEAGAVVSVEIDDAFASMTEEFLGGRPNVRLLRHDVLAGKNRIAPEVLRDIAEMREKFGCTRVKLVANLPYAVATPVLTNFLLGDQPFERMVTTVQWEIAERLTASPGTKEFGSLSVLVQSLANVEIVRRLPSFVFFPRPKVASAIVRVFPKAAKRAHIGDVQRFRGFLRDLYTHKRKNLPGLSSASQWTNE